MRKEDKKKIRRIIEIEKENMNLEKGIIKDVRIDMLKKWKKRSEEKLSKEWKIKKWGKGKKEKIDKGEEISKEGRIWEGDVRNGKWRKGKRKREKKKKKERGIIGIRKREEKKNKGKKKEIEERFEKEKRRRLWLERNDKRLMRIGKRLVKEKK